MKSVMRLFEGEHIDTPPGGVKTTDRLYQKYTYWNYDPPFKMKCDTFYKVKNELGLEFTGFLVKQFVDVELRDLEYKEWCKSKGWDYELSEVI
jgi:hypothetical protein